MNDEKGWKGRRLRPYHKPEIRSESYMERAALGCAKAPPDPPDPDPDGGSICEGQGFPPRKS